MKLLVRLFIVGIFILPIVLVALTAKDDKPFMLTEPYYSEN